MAPTRIWSCRCPHTQCTQASVSRNDGQDTQLRSPDKAEAHHGELGFCSPKPKLQCTQIRLTRLPEFSKLQTRVENKVNAGECPKQAHSHPRGGYKYSATPSQFTHQEQSEAVGSHSRGPEPWCLPSRVRTTLSPYPALGLPVWGWIGSASHLLQGRKEEDTGSSPDLVAHHREGLSTSFVSHEGYTQPWQQETSLVTQNIAGTEWDPAVHTTT